MLLLWKGCCFVLFFTFNHSMSNSIQGVSVAFYNIEFNLVVLFHVWPWVSRVPLPQDLSYVQILTHSHAYQSVGYWVNSHHSFFRTKNTFKQTLTVAHLGPGVFFAEQIGIEVGHLEVFLVCKAPHQFPVAHMMELLPLLLSFTALLKPRDSLKTTEFNAFKHTVLFKVLPEVHCCAETKGTHSIQVALHLLDSTRKKQKDGSLRNTQFVWKHTAF